MSAAPPDLSAPDTRRLAREGTASLLGSAISATMGFALIVVLARTLGDAGAGVVLQTIAVFTIVLSLARAGMDSAAVWIMPRLASHNPAAIRGTLTSMLLITAVLSTVCGALTVALAPQLAQLGDSHASDVADAVALVGWFLPAGALVLVALAATRGLGGIVPYVSVGSIGLPVIRPIAVWAVAIAGGSYASVALAWAAPLPLALVAAAFVLRVQVARHERTAGVRGSWRVDPAIRRSVVAYALPRTLSAGMEQSLIWLDVLIVGIIAGSAAAGIYGGASRFIAAGLIIDTALRIVVATRFSSLLFQEKYGEVQALYRIAARWLVLLSAPIYVVLAVFAPVVLGWLGPEFEQGSTALAILCVGAILTCTTGNIQSVLLMSGRSGWAAFNKAVVLALNVGGNLILIPLIGVNGAAITWAFSMLVDAVLAVIEVRHFIGIRMEFGTIAYALLIALTTFGIPAIAFRLSLGATLPALALSLAVSALLFVGWCALDRDRLQLRDFALLARRQKPREGDTLTGGLSEVASRG
ncbi:flippase [Microterricola viridarii]|nr:flippase [Microterricola viridarii]